MADRIASGEPHEYELGRIFARTNRPERFHLERSDIHVTEREQTRMRIDNLGLPAPLRRRLAHCTIEFVDTLTLFTWVDLLASPGLRRKDVGMIEDALDRIGLALATPPVHYRKRSKDTV